MHPDLSYRLQSFLEFYVDGVSVFDIEEGDGVNGWAVLTITYAHYNTDDTDPEDIFLARVSQLEALDGTVFSIRGDNYCIGDSDSGEAITYAQGHTVRLRIRRVLPLPPIVVIPVEPALPPAGFQLFTRFSSAFAAA